jgi:hypothetical protein
MKGHKGGERIVHIGLKGWERSLQEERRIMEREKTENYF